MRQLIRFVQFPFRLKVLLAEACIRLLATSLLLRLTPASRTSHYWTKPGRPSIRPPDPARIAQTCQAIVTASRYVPGATCLVQAVVGSAMLLRAGCAAEIKIGVLKDSSDLQAHAWLESGGSVLLGGEVAHYTQLGAVRNA